MHFCMQVYTANCMHAGPNVFQQLIKYRMLFVPTHHLVWRKLSASNKFKQFCWKLYYCLRWASHSQSTGLDHRCDMWKGIVRSMDQSLSNCKMLVEITYRQLFEMLLEHDIDLAALQNFTQYIWIYFFGILLGSTGQAFCFINCQPGEIKRSFQRREVYWQVRHVFVVHVLYNQTGMVSVLTLTVHWGTSENGHGSRD